MLVLLMTMVLITHMPVLLMMMVLITHIRLVLLLLWILMLARCPWGEESLLREDTDESLWFFGPAGENNYRVAGVSLD